MTEHKLNPTFSSIAGAIRNPDFLGPFIRNPNDEPLKQFTDTIGQLIKDNFTPMSAPASRPVSTPFKAN
jgi:hypothetical protein